MTTTQGSQRRPTQTPPNRYAIPLQLRYKAISKHGPLYGSGQTRMVSSKEIVFAPGDGLESGMIAEIALAWPFLLDDHIRLELVLETTILGSRNAVAEARILAYDFRTCGPATREHTGICVQRKVPAVVAEDEDQVALGSEVRSDPQARQCPNGHWQWQLSKRNRHGRDVPCGQLAQRLG